MERTSCRAAALADSIVKNDALAAEQTGLEARFEVQQQT